MVAQLVECVVQPYLVIGSNLVSGILFLKRDLIYKLYSVNSTSKTQVTMVAQLVEGVVHLCLVVRSILVSDSFFLKMDLFKLYSMNSTN